MLRSHLILFFIFLLGCFHYVQSQDIQMDPVRDNMEKFGKLMARWNRVHSGQNIPTGLSPVPEEDKEFLRQYSNQEGEHIPSIPELNGEDAAKLIDGDIIPSDEDIAAMEEKLRELDAGIARPRRAASHKYVRNWPTDKPIPYVIADGYDDYQIALIHEALKSFKENTCIEFMEDHGPEKKLEFFNDGLCYSRMGDARRYYRGNQLISLGMSCFKIHTIQHEAMHALGFAHTQSRTDRDEYVNFYSENVAPRQNYMEQFLTLKPYEFDNYSIPYEYNSVMHYPSVMGSEGSKLPVLVPKDRDYIASVGGSHGPTFNDWKAINIRYKCSGKCAEKIECQNKGYQNPRDCARCTCPPFHTGDYCEKELNVLELIPGTSEHFNVSYDSAISASTNNEPDFSEYIRNLSVIKAPEGRKILINLVEIHPKEPTNCVRECVEKAVEIVDDDLSLVGKRFCCNNRTGHTFTSKSNVVGYKVFTRPGHNFSARVLFTLVPLEEPQTNGSTTVQPTVHETSTTPATAIPDKTSPDVATETTTMSTDATQTDAADTPSAVEGGTTLPHIPTDTTTYPGSTSRTTIGNPTTSANPKNENPTLNKYKLQELLISIKKTFYDIVEKINSLSDLVGSW